MNTKLCRQRFQPCHGKELIKTIPMIPHSLYVSFKSISFYCGLALTCSWTFSARSGSKVIRHISDTKFLQPFSDKRDSTERHSYIHTNNKDCQQTANPEIFIVPEIFVMKHPKMKQNFVILTPNLTPLECNHDVD